MVLHIFIRSALAIGKKNLATAIAEILAIWHNFSLELSYTTSRQKYHEWDSGPANSQAKKSMTSKGLTPRKSLILVECIGHHREGTVGWVGSS